jgi:uncharacterized protein YbjT (DUF2867 family)
MTTGISNAPILVTGGTGTLGRHVVPLLRGAGHDVRVLSRHHQDGGPGLEYVAGDLATGDGIDAAVQDAEVIVHLAGTNKGDDVKAEHLTRAAARAGARHLVFISVVGADRIPITSRVDRAMFGYFGSKLAAEQIVASSGVPWTTLRATQFHDLLLTTAEGMSKMPVMPVPSGFRFQPIDTGEVAARLVDLSLGQPAGLVPEVGGPEVLQMPDLLRTYLRARGKHRLLVPMPVAGKAGAAFRSGANLTPERAVGRRTWEEFLAGRGVAAGVARATA